MRAGFPTLGEYLSLDERDAISVCREAEKETDFAFESLGQGIDLLPTFRHRSLRIRAKLVFGGTFLMGLSEAEEHAARAISDPMPLDTGRMRPVHEEAVGAIFVSAYPVEPGAFERITGRVVEDGTRPDGLVWLLFREAESLARSAGGRLLTEAEWEYCCRATTRSLFFFGDTLPPRVELEELVRLGFASGKAHRCNGFGLYGILSGEWCSDRYGMDYTAGATIQPGFRVVRGGGSGLWPWQSGTEWSLCVSANRHAGPDFDDEENPFHGKSPRDRLRAGLAVWGYVTRIAWSA
jgi:hypothetical protein